MTCACFTYVIRAPPGNHERSQVRIITKSRTLIGSFVSTLALLLASAAPMPLDDEQCTTSGVNDTWGAWAHEDCGTSAPVCNGTEKCSTAGHQESPGVWVSYCGCPGAGGEPECCHMVLRSRDSGPFLPFAEGNCSSQQAGCDAGNTCGYKTTGDSRDAECTLQDIPT